MSQGLTYPETLSGADPGWHEEEQRARDKGDDATQCEQAEPAVRLGDQQPKADQRHRAS